MKYSYRPKNKLEHFGFFIYKTLVDNFPQTFFVGGMVRDLLLYRKVTDVDIATEAKPDEIIKLLTIAGIACDSRHKQFGVIVAGNKPLQVEIATFRKESYINSRYPKISFIKSPKPDSQRRDFTINALYLSPKSNKILDFHKGLADLRLNRVRFIGDPGRRIAEDPLRIIRAFRFQKTLGLKLDHETKKSIEKNIPAVKSLTTSRIKNELGKIKSLKIRKSIAAMLKK